MAWDDKCQKFVADLLGLGDCHRGLNYGFPRYNCECGDFADAVIALIEEYELQHMPPRTKYHIAEAGKKVGE